MFEILEDILFRNVNRRNNINVIFLVFVLIDFLFQDCLNDRLDLTRHIHFPKFVKRPHDALVYLHTNKVIYTKPECSSNSLLAKFLKIANIHISWEIRSLQIRQCDEWFISPLMTRLFNVYSSNVIHISLNNFLFIYLSVLFNTEKSVWCACI